MAVRKRNEFLDANLSEDDALSTSSEVAADSRAATLASRRSKRRKLEVEHSESEDDTDPDAQENVPSNPVPEVASKAPRQSANSPTNPKETTSTESSKKRKTLNTSAIAATNNRAHKTGVIYLSRIPPFMRPSTVRTLLSTHGTITRLFLTPEAPSNYLARRKAGGNKKHSYIDGWVEFSKRRDARICAEAINGRIVGGKKGGWYRDDVWNARYLKGFGWGDLMAGVMGEEREREERVRVGLGREGRERKEFLRNLERGKVEETRRAKKERRREREGKDTGVGEGEGEGEEKEKEKEKEKTNRYERIFRQNEVKGRRENAAEQSDETKRILSKIF